MGGRRGGRDQTTHFHLESLLQLLVDTDTQLLFIVSRARLMWVGILEPVPASRLNQLQGGGSLFGRVFVARAAEGHASIDSSRFCASLTDVFRHSGRGRAALDHAQPAPIKTHYIRASLSDLPPPAPTTLHAHFCLRAPLHDNYRTTASFS